MVIDSSHWRAAVYIVGFAYADMERSMLGRSSCEGLGFWVKWKLGTLCLFLRKIEYILCFLWQVSRTKIRVSLSRFMWRVNFSPVHGESLGEWRRQCVIQNVPRFCESDKEPHMRAPEGHRRILWGVGLCLKPPCVRISDCPHFKIRLWIS